MRYKHLNPHLTTLALVGILLALSGCGGSGGKGDGASPESRGKDETAILAPGSSPEKTETLEGVTFPTTRGDSFVDQTAAVHNGPSRYWIDQTGLGQNNNMTWTYVNGGGISNSMLWRSGQPGGRYEVLAFIPRNYATTRSAKYRMMDGPAPGATKTINQYSYSDVWVSLGTYDFAREPGVLLGDDTGESYSTKRMVGFDAIRFVQVSTGGGGGGGTGGGGITVPGHLQTNTLWAKKKMLPSKLLMKDAGCLVTCLASVAGWAGYSTDPGQFCDWLSGHGGFDRAGYWTSDANLSNYTGGRARVTGRKDWESTAADPNVAASEIDAGRPIVLKVHYTNTSSNSAQHWVVAYAYTRNGSVIDDFKIMDPMGQFTTLKGYYFGSTFAKKVYAAKLVAK